MCPWMLALFQNCRHINHLSSKSHSKHSHFSSDSDRRESLALSPKLKDVSTVFHDNRQCVVSLLRDSANELTFRPSDCFEYPSGLLGCIYDFACGVEGVAIQRSSQYLMCFECAGNQSEAVGNDNDYNEHTLVLGNHEIECYPWGLRYGDVVCYHGQEAHREKWEVGDAMAVMVDTRRGGLRIDVWMTVGGCKSRPMGIGLAMDSSSKQALPLHVSVRGGFTRCDCKGIKLD